MVNPLNKSQSTETLDHARSARNIATSKPIRSRTNAPGQAGGEQLVVSAKGQQARSISQAAQQSNGVDPARVQAIRDLLSSGQSIASPHGIASALLGTASGVTGG